MSRLRASSPDLELGRPTGVGLLGLFDLSLPNWAFSSPGNVALPVARDTVESCAVVFLTAILRAMAGRAAKATPSYTFTVLCSMIILIALEALGDIATSIE